MMKDTMLAAVHCDRLMELIACGKLNTDFLITHRTPLNEILEGYRVFENKLDECIKWALTPPVHNKRERMIDLG